MERRQALREAASVEAAGREVSVPTGTPSASQSIRLALTSWKKVKLHMRRCQWEQIYA